MKLAITLILFALVLSPVEMEAASKKRICAAVLGGLVGVSVTGIGSHQLITNALYARNPTDKKVVNTDGASITAGTGASLPIQMRIRHHLQSNGIDIEKIMNGKDLVLMPDYFFPSNFPEIDKLSPDEMTKKVEQIVHSHLEKYDFVLIGKLPTEGAFDHGTLASVSENHPVRFVLTILETGEVRKANVVAINDTLDELGKLDGVIVLDPTEFSNVLLSMGERASDLMPDRIHPNNNGQALLFNTMILPGLNQIGRLNGAVPPMTQRNAWQQAIERLNSLPVVGRVATDFSELAIKAQVQTVSSFKVRTPGLYWLKFGEGQTDVLKDDSSLVVPNELPNQYGASIAELKAIHGAVKSLVPFMPNGFTVTIINNEEERSIALNLAQALFYTSIELKETAPGSNIFEGFGYDFWSSVDTENPPRVNYFFRASLDETDGSKMKLNWEILPLIRDEGGQLLQEDPLLRLGYVDSETQVYLEQHRNDLPRLEFKLELKITD